jgi:hypothetical protein
MDSLFNCRTLNLNHNILVRLPRCLGRMPSLTCLSASRNQISYLPKELCLSKTLKILRVNSNLLSIFPHNLGDIKKLYEISACYNNITQLPMSFYKLGKLSVLRMEGNPMALPEDEIMMRGGPAVVQWCRERYLHDEQNRMRGIVNATQLLLEDVIERGLFDPTLFRTEFEEDGDRWYATQWEYLIDTLIPRMKELWHKEALARERAPQSKKQIKHKEFPFDKKEVYWAWSSYGDAYGGVMKRQKCWFTLCGCVDAEGKRKPCVPPKLGYMCDRQATMLKVSLVLKRQKQERLWNAYITNGVEDGVRRAEKEAKDYLDSTEGALWLTQLAYEKAEELLEEKGAGRAIKWRDKLVEKKKKKLLHRYARLKKRVTKVPFFCTNTSHSFVTVQSL